ncbi:MAG: penicillin acylase family protein [Chloroflexi bacterium]|nr:penicillin acylase family protein [Chloroflexota bacterium]
MVTTTEWEQAVLALLRGAATPETVQGMDLATARREFFARRVAPVEGTARGPVRGRVEIVTDRRGVPHIFAGQAWDLFVAFGFAVGRERLWQLDYRRRFASGTLAEVLGRSALRGDVEARTLDFRGIAAREWERQTGEVREALEAYAAGVNLAREQCLAQRTLPVEFALLDYEPPLWHPIDSLAIARVSVWQFSGRIEGIVLAEAALRCLPPHLAKMFLAVEADEQAIVTEPLRWPAASGNDGETAGAEPATPESVPGSNQFTAGPSRTRAGKPVLASDGHIPYTQPSSLFEIHLCSAGCDVIGIAGPGLPVIQNGRNRRVAWGSTNNVSSGRDLYVETVDPAQPDQYQDGDSWRSFETRMERIAVHGEADHQLVLRSTVRGPVVNHLIPSVNPAGDPPLSLRWVGFEPEDTIGVALDLIRAGSADEARAVHRRHLLATNNPGFADVDGHFGYQMRGRFPLRGRMTRGFRRAGEPGDEWRGFVPFDDLPAERDPQRGWTGSANNRPAPDGYAAPFYGAYADGYRMRRIRTLLDSAAELDPDALGAMQNDTFSGRAADVCPSLVARLTLRSGQLNTTGQQALAVLRTWDYCFDVDRTGASVFQAFWLEWTRRVAAARFPAHLARSAAGGCSHVAHRIITDGDGPAGGEPWFPHGRAQAEIVSAFVAGVSWLRERLGPDAAQWAWGALHPVTFRHALASRFPACTELNAGPFPCPGTTGVLNQNGFSAGERYEVTSGPHFRFVADLAVANQALGTHTTGNSGHPGSPHYADQCADWLAGRYHPMHMDRADITAHAEGSFVLEPA